MTQNNPTTAVELLPCPFCGAEVTLEQSHVVGEGAYIHHVARVGGNNCGIEGFSDFSLEGDLATAWNTRLAHSRNPSEDAERIARGHRLSCPSLEGGDELCDCGFDAAVSALRSAS